MLFRSRITPDAFARHRNALILELEEEPKNLFEQAGRYWRDLTRKRYDFDSREQLLAAVADIALEDWLTYFRQTHLEQPRSVLMYTSGRFDDPGIDRQLHEGRAAISDYQAFKAERPVYLLD